MVNMSSSRFALRLSAFAAPLSTLKACQTKAASQSCALLPVYPELNRDAFDS